MTPRTLQRQNRLIDPSSGAQPSLCTGYSGRRSTWSQASRTTEAGAILCRRLELLTSNQMVALMTTGDSVPLGFVSMKARSASHLWASLPDLAFGIADRVERVLVCP